MSSALIVIDPPHNVSIRDRQRLEDDFALLTERSKDYVGDYRMNLQRDFAAVVAKWDDAL